MSEPRRIRCTVESMNYSACGLRIGDWFELGDDGISLPPGGGFCWFAIAAALPALVGRIDDDAWFACAPRIACPDPPEALHMRIERT
jgi:uncharacterized repeat protein (TIGR04076 family)